MKIAIKFGDNDYHATWKGVLKTLHNAYRYQGRLPSNKEELLTLINNISYGTYLLFQNQFEYETGLDESRTRKYLTLDGHKLLINKEVDEYLDSLPNGWDNSSTFILDTSLYNNCIYSV